jgi:hypothetical protein
LQKRKRLYSFVTTFATRKHLQAHSKHKQTDLKTDAPPPAPMCDTPLTLRSTNPTHMAPSPKPPKHTTHHSRSHSPACRTRRRRPCCPREKRRFVRSSTSFGVSTAPCRLRLPPHQLAALSTRSRRPLASSHQAADRTLRRNRGTPHNSGDRRRPSARGRTAPASAYCTARPS